MKHKYMKRAVAVSLLLPAFAFGLSVETDRADAIYALNSNAVFEVSGMGAGRLEYVLSHRGGELLGEGAVECADAPIRIEGSLDYPGFLHCSVVFTPANGGAAERKTAVAAFEPERIRPAEGHRPEDFEAFWRHKKEQLSAIPMDPVLNAVSGGGGEVQAFDVTVACLGFPVRGYYARPTGAAEASCPAILFFKGAGVKPAELGSAVAYAKEGFVAFSINALGIENGKPEAYYRNLAETSFKRYKYIGRENRDTSFFTGMFLRAFRALEFLKAQPGWDGKNLIVHGSSQGGAQALAAAGLDSDVSFLFAGVPGMCDHGGVVNGWPRLASAGKDGRLDPRILEASKYVDCVNFAQDTTIPALFTVGFIDNTCRPESVYAAYNSYAGPKEIINEPQMGHAIPKHHKEAAKKRILAMCRRQPGGGGPGMVYLAPEGRGRADGSGVEDAASYTEEGVWESVNAQLEERPVTVFLADGFYSRPLILECIGNARHALALKGGSGGDAVFNAPGSVLLELRGCQNMVLENLSFTGAGTGYAFKATKYCPPEFHEQFNETNKLTAAAISAADGTVSKNIAVRNCRWHDMERIVYGAAGVSYGSHDVVFENCRFERIGQSTRAHMLYNAYDADRVGVLNCRFEDCAGSYVRFRAGSDHGVVSNCTFVSTQTYANRSPAWEIFVDFPLFNDVDPGDETFAKFATVSGNAFLFHPDSPTRRAGVRFYHMGHNPPGWNHLMTASEGAVLKGTDTAAKKRLLKANCGIDFDEMVIEGNIWQNETSRILFGSYSAYGAASEGWDDIADVSDVVFGQ